ncbi:MAG: hypothetical protein JKY43_00455 [Phycisphaerales bacterium]|nr:hypothetical protein [Phycisphaerales bacterium]
MGFLGADFPHSLYDSVMEYGPIAPSWFVLPLAMAALLVVAAHLIVLREHAIGKMPESRRQIRMVTGWVMMFTIPLLAYGFGIVSPTNEQQFLLAWTCITGLLAGIVLMACVDAINSIRIARSQSKAFWAQLQEVLIEPEHDG